MYLPWQRTASIGYSQQFQIVLHVAGCPPPDYGDDDDDGLDQTAEQSREPCEYITAVRCNTAACYGSSFRLDTLAVCSVRASQCTRVAVTCTECLYGVTILFVFIIPGRC